MDPLNLHVNFASFVTGQEFDQGRVDGVGIGIRRVGGLRSVRMEVGVINDVVGADDDVVVVVVVVVIAIDDGAVVECKIIVIDIVVATVDISIF